jgi:DNA polymerase III alpha subunit
MAARLAVWGGYYSPRVYMSEARRLGLAIRPPHVNHSREAFTLEPPHTLCMGLDQVRELTRTTIESIGTQRPFDSLEDFLSRARPQHVEAVNLVKAGALEGLGNAGAMLALLEQTRWRGRRDAQMGLSFATPSFEARQPTLQERAAWERDVLGMPVSVHPLQLVAGELSRLSLTRSDQVGAHAGREVAMAGVRLAAHRFAGSQGEPMLLVDMEDEAGIYQVLWSGPVLTQRRALLASRDPVLIRGRVRTDRQGCFVIVGQDVTRVEGAMPGE